MPSNYRCVVYDTSKTKTPSLRYSSLQNQEEWSHKWDKSFVTYSVLTKNEDSLNQKDLELGMNLAMTTWDFHIPLKLIYVSPDENPDITVQFKTPEEDNYLKSHAGVLAYAYFPKTSKAGIIVFSSAYIWTLNGKPINNTNTPNKGDKLRTHNIIHTLIHEIGHSLGLTHDEHNDTSDVMDPIYSGQTELSDWDIQRIVAKYGKRTFRIPSHLTRLTNWLAKRIERLG